MWAQYTKKWKCDCRYKYKIEEWSCLCGKMSSWIFWWWIISKVQAHFRLGFFWEVVYSLRRIMIPIWCNKFSCMFLGWMKLVDVKVPTPSISFQISSSQGFSKPLGFHFHNFQGISRDKLKDLKRTLEVLCILQQKFPLTSQNNEKLWFFASCNGQISRHLPFKDSIMFMEDFGMIIPLFYPVENILNISKLELHFSYRFLIMLFL